MAKTMYAHLGMDRLLVFLDLASIIPRRDVDALIFVIERAALFWLLRPG